MSWRCTGAWAPGAVLVRDTKDNGHGPVLAITPEDWHRFTQQLRGQ